jgi:hypothetical protein
MQDGSGRVYLPGETAEVAVAEVAAMIAGGWIVDPNDTSPPISRTTSRLAPDNPGFIGLQSQQEM